MFQIRKTLHTRCMWWHMQFMKSTNDSGILSPVFLQCTGCPIYIIVYRRSVKCNHAMDLRKRHFWHLILCSMVFFQFVSLYFLLQARQKDILVTLPSTDSDSQTKELTRCETVVYKQSTEDDTVYSDMWYTSEINRKTLLLILIFSRPASGDLRITCRNTWLNWIVDCIEFDRHDKMNIS